MTIKPGSIISQAEAVNRGFSRQSAIYDEADRNNPVLQDLRHQVYAHVQKFLKPASRILELNAGTGLDALYFVSQGHRIHATDLSDGMISQVKRKIQQNDIASQLTCQQLSYTELDKSSEKGFDYVFSNFGGLNCVRDLSQVTQNLSGLLNDEAYITLVIMPPISPWELTWVLKGDLQKAVRRLRKEGAVAHLEADYILKLERYILANGGCGAVAGRLMQLESGTWTDQYPIKSFNELCWRFIFQLSVWGRIDKVRVPGVMKWCFEIINDFYRRKGNTLSLAGWPLITQWDASIVRTTIYSLGASLIKKEWLANAYDEVLDPYGIGDNYGAALHFPSGQQIHILGDARAYHHRVSENRLERTLASYRRILALHYFLVRDKKSFVTRFFFVWSLFGNMLASMLRGDWRTFRMTIRALALILRRQNPYWIGHLQNKKLVQPFP